MCVSLCHASHVYALVPCPFLNLVRWLGCARRGHSREGLACLLGCIAKSLGLDLGVRNPEPRAIESPAQCATHTIN